MNHRPVARWRRPSAAAPWHRRRTCHRSLHGSGPLLGAVLVILICGSPAASQSPPPQSPPPPQVQQLLRLMQDPEVRAWIDREKQAAPVAAEAAPQPPLSEMMTERITGLRAHLASLVSALPDLPGEFRRALGRLLDELQGRSAAAVVVLIAGFLALGAGSEWLFRLATAPVRRRIGTGPSEVRSARLRAIGLSLTLSLAGVAIFMLGSLGAFLPFEWPRLLRQVVAAYLAAAIVLRLTLLGSRALLAPEAASPEERARFRMLPLPDRAARFWYRHLALFCAWFAFGWATVDVLRVLGFSGPARALVAYGLGLGLLAIGLRVVWAAPMSSTQARPPGSGMPPGGATAVGEGPVAEMATPSPGGERGGSVRTSRPIVTALLSLLLLLLWIVWVAGMSRLFWLGAVALLLPISLKVAHRAVSHVLRVSGDDGATSEPSLVAIFVDRSLRAALVAGAVLVLAWAWQVDLVEMTNSDTLLTRSARGLLSGVIILLVADLIWQVTRTMIDRRLSRATDVAAPGSDEALRQARLRTLLPIFRRATFILLAVVAILMALSALGVEIGPLIAGAGIAGVAIGFGSQTLVKDVISGVFYLLDDAFRVGEYIQSGSYKGTVESLGFRSVKLRHHRGPIFTVPYGQLGAVENMSRDWVIDKITINVTYGTDLDKARKIIKQVGKDLAQDPESAPHIIEPLKMQGVEQFGDFAIALRLKMMTRPGEQFVIRRKAYAMLKKAFDENGIQFAFPTVQVATREDVEPAAARQVLTLIPGKTAEESPQTL